MTLTTVPPAFKAVFCVIVLFTCISFMGLGALAFWGSDVEEAGMPIFQRNFSAACQLGWQAGLGAILGLLGGKAV